MSAAESWGSTDESFSRMMAKAETQDLEGAFTPFICFIFMGNARHAVELQVPVSHHFQPSFSTRGWKHVQHPGWQCFTPLHYDIRFLQHPRARVNDEVFVRQCVTVATATSACVRVCVDIWNAAVSRTGRLEKIAREYNSRVCGSASLCRHGEALILMHTCKQGHPHPL